jgi:transglutaminase-like putative cysteine protease
MSEETKMRLSAGCEIVLESDVPYPVPLILMLSPLCHSNQQTIIEEHQTFSPQVLVQEYKDSFGNTCQRMQAPPGRFVIATHVIVETSPTIDVTPGASLNLITELPDDALQFLLPSRYCPSDLMLMGSTAHQVTQNCLPGYDQVEAIRAWIHHNIAYCYGISDTSTSAQNTLQDKRGVCRDFAHLGMALCRSLTIPARMVVGYLHNLKPMDMHAWFEAFIGGRWYTFDATQEHPCGGRIVIACGRDAADVALLTQFGPSILTEMCVWVNVVPPIAE